MRQVGSFRRLRSLPLVCVEIKVTFGRERGSLRTPFSFFSPHLFPLFGVIKGQFIGRTYLHKLRGVAERD